MNHSIKILPEHFEAVLSGKKTAELRYNDRAYKVGDTLLLKEWLGDYTGRIIFRKISHIHEGLGLAEGYCMLSFKLFTDEDVVNIYRHIHPTGQKANIIILKRQL